MDADQLFTNPMPVGELSPLSIPDILKRIREGVVIVSANLRVAYANDAALNVFAWEFGSVIDRRLSEVVRDVSVHTAFKKALKKGKSSQVAVEIISNSTRSFDVDVTPLGFDESKFAIGVFYETTKIEHLERVRQEFLSNISHELRTPLTSILAFVETLENGGVDDQENNRRFLSIIQKNAERMQHLIQDISELSSIEAGKIKIVLQPIILRDLVSNLVVSLKSEALDRSVDLLNRVDPDFEVYADRFRLEQMLTNLIDNAIKFNKESGTVTVSSRLDRQYVHIIVSDTGDGISETHIPRVFERLYRGDRARSRDVGGTGLGLAIVKHLVRLHSGEVTVESVVGQGSTFTISLPVKR